MTTTTREPATATAMRAEANRRAKLYLERALEAEGMCGVLCQVTAALAMLKLADWAKGGA